MNEKSNSSPRVLIFTGDGKGKTTAAFGCVLRAIGHGLSCGVVQYMKKDTGSGEVEACKKMQNVELKVCGKGFVPSSDSPEFATHREAAEKAQSIAEEMISTQKHSVIVLDEILGSVAKGLLTEERVCEMLTRVQRSSMAVILTGRSAPQALIDHADTVTDMRCVKHALSGGVASQIGVEM